MLANFLFFEDCHLPDGYHFGQNSIVTRDSAIVITEQASITSPAAGEGALWVRNDAPNEMVFERDDGASVDLSRKDFALLTLSADQTSNLAAGSNHHVEFDTDTADGLTLETGAGQSDGILQLNDNKTYVLIANLGVNFSSSAGALEFTWWDNEADVAIGVAGVAYPVSHASNFIPSSLAVAILQSAAAPNDVEVRFTATTSITSIESTDSKAVVWEISDDSAF